MITCTREQFLESENKRLKAINLKLKSDLSAQAKGMARLSESISSMNDDSEELKQIRESLNNMTAEKGKWLRKLKRAGVKL